ncbi:MAG TPA: heme-binding domain-containing protein, partial [Chitinophagaceae bacterium]|nr:heme-binding domain-containing protein [Chitinophagaceae bacterium]
MTKRRMLIWTILLLFVAIQFIRPRRNSEGKIPDLSFARLYAVPDSVDRVLREACYDCHSNHTRYPWYTNVQPLDWIMAGHVRRGKAELNFSEFYNYSSRRQASKLKAIAGQIEDNKMPLRS